ncbi:MAG TPA: amidohydrolase family protein [Gemmatimonadaceae bacterium]|nr:amidohydrolase family protein [Gemmatimonadaceae bacterium]
MSSAVLVLCALVVSAAAAAQPSRGALASDSFAITGVGLIPMTDGDTLVRDATVLVRNGRIAAAGPRAGVRIPAGVRTIDGGGKFVIPGLADMHTHLFADGPAADSLAPYELGVMVALGVTTARLMIGTNQHLVLRREIAAGRLLGPQLWLASPHLTGREDPSTSFFRASTPAEARWAVHTASDSGYDFVKVTFIDPPIWDIVIREARLLGIRVDGHVEPGVGVARALEAQQHIQHLDSYLEAVLADDAPIQTSLTQYGLFRLNNWRSMDYIDDAKIARVAGATARAGVYSTPTLAVFNTAFAKGQSEAEIRARPDWQVLTEAHRTGYLRALRQYWAPANDSVRTPARRQRYVQVRNAIVKAIADSGGGGRLLAGSDSPEWFLAYGWTLHRELAAFVEAGLTPYQALLTATRNPAEFLGASAEWGSIAVGKRADLVLLNANPLEDIRRTVEIEAVSIGGRWIDRAERERMIRAAAERVGAGAGAGTGDR